MTVKEQSADKELKSRSEIEELISRAIKKISGKGENDLCKFLPVEGGGYMHHFTFKKKKKQNPKQLIQMIESNITEKSDPRKVPHKPRRPRGSRKKHDLIALTRMELERVLSHVRQAGDQEIAAKLSPRKSLPQLKKQLIASIRKGEVNLELWTAYSDAARGYSPLDPAQLGTGHVLVSANS